MDGWGAMGETRPKSTHDAAAQPHGLSDTRMDAWMGRLLQAGVLLASTIVLLGGFVYLRRHGADAPGYRKFISEPASLREPAALFHALKHGDSAAIIQVGILCLIATPVARVVFALIAFAVQRDRLYTLISVTVLAILIFGMLNSG